MSNRRLLLGIPPLALAIVGLALLVSACRAPAPEPALVILLSIDTLRADHVGFLGGTAARTPNLDRIAREGAVVERCWAPFPRTTQSVGSFLTGLHPLRHGADALDMRLPEDVTTIAEILSGEGYRSAAFATNLVLRPGRGFEQGFELYSNTPQRWVGNSAASVVAEALAWLDDQPAAGRAFLWVHLLDPHWPYEPPAAAESARRILERVRAAGLSEGEIIFRARSVLSEEEIEELRRLYALEVESTDAAIGAFVAGLEERGLWDAATLVLTSDHGESLGENDYWFAHGEYLYDGTLRVPLAIRSPGRIDPGLRVSGPAILEDLAPTILDIAGAGIPEGLDGVSLLPALRGNGALPERDLYHLADHHLIRDENPRRPVAGRDGRWASIRRGQSKLIRIPIPRGAAVEELYDLAADPGETRNLAESEPELARELGRALDAAAARYARSPRRDVESPDAETLDALRSLGYVH